MEFIMDFIAEHPYLFAIIVIIAIMVNIHFMNEFRRKEKCLTVRKSQLDKEVERGMVWKAAKVRSRSYFASTPVFSRLSSVRAISQEPALDSALHEFATLDYPLSVFTKITDLDSTYLVSLTNCTCDSFRNGAGIPCKHMYRLALEVGVLLNCNFEDKESFFNQFRTIKHESNKALQELAQEKDWIRKEVRALQSDPSFRKNFAEEPTQSLPYIAQLLVNFNCRRYDDLVAARLVSAPVTAKKVSQFVHQNMKQIDLQRRLAENQLAVYESLFPWLLDFKELTPSEATEVAAAAEAAPEDEETYSYFKQWLSPEEYRKLSDTAKYQLALDRWREKHFYHAPSAWSAGIAYERYVGYLYESDGYKVEYNGALKGNQDMGRDLIAFKGRKVILVQCKRYRETKQIHENTVFQLYGSMIQYSIVHPETEVDGMIYTTAPLSDVASQCAERMGIQVVQCPFDKDYPLVKCNIGNKGKIYHLPFDQQYDTTRITVSAGECYVSTVAEAEHLGFRRAYRWRGTP